MFGVLNRQQLGTNTHRRRVGKVQENKSEGDREIERGIDRYRERAGDTEMESKQASGRTCVLCCDVRRFVDSLSV